MKKKNIVFAQDIHPYRHEMLICVGATKEDVAKYIKKTFTKKIQSGYFKWIDSKFLEEVKAGKQLGFAIADLEKQYLAMILPKFEDDWSYWECLIHELSHIIDWVVDWKMLNGEGEARAYLHEWLFREIRRKLQGTDKI